MNYRFDKSFYFLQSYSILEPIIENRYRYEAPLDPKPL
jgi:hypothetical protein